MTGQLTTSVHQARTISRSSISHQFEYSGTDVGAVGTDSGFGRLFTHQLGTKFGSPTHLLLEVGWFSSQMGTLSSWGLRLEAGLSDDSNRDNCIHLASFVNYLGLNRGCEQKMW